MPRPQQPREPWKITGHTRTRLSFFRKYVIQLEEMQTVGHLGGAFLSARMITEDVLRWRDVTPDDLYALDYAVRALKEKAANG